MSYPPTPVQRVPFDLGRAQRRKTMAAYAAVLVVFAAAYAHSALMWPSLLASAYGLIPISWAQTVVDWSYWAEIRGPVLAWTAALVIAVVLVWRRVSVRPALVRAVAVTVAMVLALPGLWAVLHSNAVSSGDVWWRLVQLCGVLALVVAWSAASGLGRADLGVDRPVQRDTKGMLDAVRLSIFGFGIAGAGKSFAAALVPLGAAVSAERPSWWLLVLLPVVDAVVEETVCTAWLYTQARRAGRPLWEVYALAAVMRASFHLFMGIGGLSAAAFAMCNITAYHRSRRLLPLIAVHAAVDIAISFTTGNVAGRPLTAVLPVVFVVVGSAPSPSEVKARWRKLRSRGGRDYSFLDKPSANELTPVPRPSATTDYDAATVTMVDRSTEDSSGPIPTSPGRTD